MGSSSIWDPVEDGRCYGVARCHFDGDKVSHHVNINLGEAVRIKGESRDWFYVQKVHSQEEGILPKSFVHIQECNVVRWGEAEFVTPKLAPVVHEITAVLREWHKIAKKGYVERKEEFITIRNMILELHDCRRKISLPNLTVEGLKELKKQVARIIDNGNNLLSLDMSVRDENGNPLNPSCTSTIELFRQHQIASAKLKRNGKSAERRSKVFAHSSHSLLVIVEKTSWQIVDECEVRFFLYDATAEKEGPFSESAQYVTRASFNSKSPLKILFTDLGKTDFDRKKVYLVAYVVRIGAMKFKEVDPKKDSAPFSQKATQQVRRPWCVAAKEVTTLFRENYVSKGDDELHTVLHLPVGEDFMEVTLQKLISTKEAQSQNGKDVKSGLALRLSMIPGTPVQIQEEQPIRLRGTQIIARKMGFPDVIFPNDIRNDLYVNLIRGEFHRVAKTSEKNVEITVSVHNDKGQLLKGILYGGSGCDPVSQYKSVVYYHSDKPRWNEYFKIALPMSIDEFSTAHIKFIFKHRSSSDTQEKAEKPYALAFIRLREREGTAIEDGVHELIAYRLDPKHYKETEVNYLGLHSVRSRREAKLSCPGFSLSNKDFFCIRTTLCSTKFTQNAGLLELLQWSTKNVREQSDCQQETLIDQLLKILQKVQEVPGEEIVKFLPDVFDALFSILVDPVGELMNERSSDSHRQSSISDRNCLEDLDRITENCDRPVFNCLIYIFGLILDHKYQNFQSVLSLYIEDAFSSTLAYKKLIRELQHAIQNSDNSDQDKKVLKIMKSIDFFFNFIVKSFENRIRALNMEGRSDQGTETEEFERLLSDLFKSMCQLLQKPEDKFLTAQGGCLKHIPSVIEGLITVFPAHRLSDLLVQLLVKVPKSKLTKQKLTTITDIVHSPLFLDAECRFLLLPIVAKSIHDHLPGNDEDMRRRSLEAQHQGSTRKIMGFFGDVPNNAKVSQAIDTSTNSEETQKCVELLSDVMDILHKEEPGEESSHISYIMQILLRPIILSIGTIGENDPMAGNMVAIVLSLFRQMSAFHYGTMINKLKGETVAMKQMDPFKLELLKFLNDVLVVLKNLFYKPYFSNDWVEMILLQNNVVLKALEHFAETIRAECAEPFEDLPWNNFFQCAVSFLTQESLQLETFTAVKRLSITSRYGDMRKKAAELIRFMWFSLGESKRIKFVPLLVGTFLDMAFVPEPELRENTIPIFFDMMHCEFDQDRPLKSFKNVEDELIKRIVEGVEGRKGDAAFRDIFYKVMSEMCEHNNSGLKHPGLMMVKTITKLLELLLEYREVIHEEDCGNRMSCIVNLLDFSKEIDRKELYLRYLYKLHDLHIQANNFTEAAFTLKLHSRQLEWSDEEVPNHLKTNVYGRHPNLHTQMELKEALYNDTIEYFSKGKMWECALEVCDELRQQYSEESYNYAQLPKLHHQMADLYDKILKENRFDAEYFRVAFYGRGFPSFLQNKVFIYRGGFFEKLSDFEVRMLERYPQAELFRTLSSPSDEVRYSNHQYLQICKVDPVMNETKRLSGMRYADENIRKYYRSNDIEVFTYSRPYHDGPRDSENEFASLWLDRYKLTTAQSFPGIMSWFPVIRDMATKVRPIQNAIETLEKANEKLREMILSHCSNPKEDCGPLSMKLNGILDAAVMGGIANYEKAFITPDYLARHPEDEGNIETLKRLIFIQVPIMEECLRIHEKKCGPSLLPLQKKLEERFQDFVKHIETSYGVNTKDLSDDNLVREIYRVSRKHQFRSQDSTASQQKEATARHSEFMSNRNSSALGRSMGSFSSTVSLYHNSGAPPKSKSSNSISQKSQHMFRRSAHSSFSGSVEGEQLVGGHVTGGSYSATLPRNGQFYNAAPSFTKMTTIDSVGGSSTELIPLTQTRPPRSTAEQRKSHSWTTNGDGRHSGISIMSGNSLDTYRPSPSEPTSRNSVTYSPDSAIDADCDESAPPLPPKQSYFNKVEGKPPTPPPKKPPLH